MIRKLIFAAAAILIGYWIFLLAIEGTALDNPKIFFIEEQSAQYAVTVDQSSGYYYLEGDNHYPHRGNFRIPIASAPANLSKLVGKKITIQGRTGWIEARNMICRKDSEEWCKSRSRLIAVFIEKLKVL